jgi:hypothetical protein
MNLKYRALGAVAALGLTLGAIAPASAATAGTVNVTVTITDGGTGTPTLSVLGTSDTDFGTFSADAAGDVNTGLFDGGTAALDLALSGDNKLYRAGGSISITLGTGTAASAQMNLTSGDPTFLGADTVDFQIPGRYVSITGMNNPQQAKFTNVGGTSTAPIWSGTTGTVGGVGRPPRVAGSATTGQAIYRVGDVGGTFNNPANAGCNVTTGTAVQSWISSCGDPTFSEGNITKQVAYMYPGSGTVTVVHRIELGLKIPAGVYPGTYTGVLTIDMTFS